MKNLKILIIEDNKINCDIITEVVRLQGHTPMGFTDAQKAIQEINTAKPDVILMDIMMPGVDGLDLCRKIREDKSLDHIKIIICTAKNYMSDRRMAVESGADGYIVKPFNKDSVKKIEAIVHEEIKIKFWGVRGTLPVSHRRSTKYGGNTSCVSVTFPDNSIWIFDAGSGIKFLSEDIMKSGIEKQKIKIFISHPHWDHINALPFFAPLYIPGNKIEIYGPKCYGKSIEELVFSQMDDIHFPITTEEMGAEIAYTDLQEGSYKFGKVELQTILLTHPGNCLGYRINYGGLSLCYCTDNELYLPDSPSYSEDIFSNLVNFTKETNLLITDTTYADETYQKKIHWGHSCVSRVADLACKSQCETLAIFHHDPEQTDSDIDAKLNCAKKVIEKSQAKVQCFAPVEEEVFRLKSNKD